MAQAQEIIDSEKTENKSQYILKRPQQALERTMIIVYTHNTAIIQFKIRSQIKSNSSYFLCRVIGLTLDIHINQVTKSPTNILSLGNTEFCRVAADVSTRNIFKQNFIYNLSLFNCVLCYLELLGNCVWAKNRINSWIFSCNGYYDIRRGLLGQECNDQLISTFGEIGPYFAAVVSVRAYLRKSKGLSKNSCVRKH